MEQKLVAVYHDTPDQGGYNIEMIDAVGLQLYFLENGRLDKGEKYKPIFGDLGEGWTRFIMSKEDLKQLGQCASSYLLTDETYPRDLFESDAKLARGVFDFVSNVLKDERVPTIYYLVNKG